MDNFYHECPAMMSDGRHFTDYKTPTRRNEYVRYINGITRDDNYRMFLQKNGAQIMDNIHNYHRRNDSCWVNECVHNYPTRSIPRHLSEERINHDKIFGLHKRPLPGYVCQQYKDYRLNK